MLIMHFKNPASEISINSADKIERFLYSNMTFNIVKVISFFVNPSLQSYNKTNFRQSILTSKLDYLERYTWSIDLHVFLL